MATDYSSLTTQIDTFIDLAESRISRELETRSQDTRTTLTTSADNAYVSLPTDMRSIRNVKVMNNPRVTLRYLSPLQVKKEYATTGTGLPRVYSVIGDNLFLAPTPDSILNIELTYKASVSSLSDSNTTNTILTRFPDLYLYASLFHAYTYLLDEQRATQYNALVENILQSIRIDEEKGNYGVGLEMRGDYGEIR
jgi:hypothetical protein